jgi:hypothetical protein
MNLLIKVGNYFGNIVHLYSRKKIESLIRTLGQDFFPTYMDIDKIVICFEVSL